MDLTECVVMQMGRGELWRGQRDVLVPLALVAEVAGASGHLPQGHSHEAIVMRPVNVRLALDSFPPRAPQPQGKSARVFGPVERLNIV